MPRISCGKINTTQQRHWPQGWLWQVATGKRQAASGKRQVETENNLRKPYDDVQVLVSGFIAGQFFEIDLAWLGGLVAWWASRWPAVLAICDSKCIDCHISSSSITVITIGIGLSFSETVSLTLYLPLSLSFAHSSLLLPPRRLICFAVPFWMVSVLHSEAAELQFTIYHLSFTIWHFNVYS